MDDRLMKLGFSERYIQEATLYPGRYLGRVISQHKERYRIAVESGEVAAELSGKLRFSADGLSGYPAVGDFVMVDRAEGGHGNAIIQQLLTRKSVFVRRAAGMAHDVQVVAANIDTVFICMSLNRDFNLRRLERYLSIAWDSGAVPVVVLTKSDLCLDLEDRLEDVKASAAGADIVVTTSLAEEGIQRLRPYIRTGQTVAFMGSSGVGKSTLINRLLGEDRILTGEVGWEDKGRHVTTGRQLLAIPSGGAVIDTPGMREIGVFGADLKKAFAEIDDYAKNCYFKDCRHENEPGCAVRRAVLEGSLSEKRLLNYKKLKNETLYEGLNAKQIEKQKTERLFSAIGGIKNKRAFIKSKSKER